MRYLTLITILTLSSFCQAWTDKEDDPKQIAISDLSWNAPMDLEMQTLIQGIFGAMDHKQVAKALRTMLTTSLQQTKRFNVIERQNMEKLLHELELVNDTGLVDPDDVDKNPRWSYFKGLEYLVLGDVTQFSVNKKGIGIGRHRMGGLTLNMTLDLRIVKVETGELISAEPIMLKKALGGSVNLGGESAGMQKGKGETRDKLMRDLSNQIVFRLVNDIAPISVIANRSGELLISYGDGLLNVGDRLGVYQLGERFKIPGTKFYDREEILVGEVEITHTQKYMSRAKGTKKSNMDSVRAGYICRPLQKKKKSEKLKFWKR